MKNIVLVAAIALALPTIANAGTCASPTPITSDVTVSGTTCGGEIGIDMAGVIYPHPSQVYSFVGDPSATGAIALTGTDREMAMTTSCNSAPFMDGYPGGPIDLDALNLVAGQTYLLIVSTDPGIDPEDPPLCGDFTVTTDTLPVSLQNVTVD